MSWRHRRRAPTAGETLALIEARDPAHGEEGPTEEELDKAKAYLKGSYALGFDTSTKIAGQLCRSSSTISASTNRTPQRPDRRRDARRRQARRQAAARERHAGHGGRPQPQGSDLEGTRRLSNCLLPAVERTAAFHAQDIRWRSQQSIDHGAAPATSPRRWRAPASGARLAARAPRRRHAAAAAAAGTTRRSRRPSRGCADAAARRRDRRRVPRHRRLEPRRPDAGAACRLCRAGRRRACASRRACISWTISIRDASARCWRGCRSRPRASSRSRSPAAPARR